MTSDEYFYLVHKEKARGYDCIRFECVNCGQWMGTITMEYALGWAGNDLRCHDCGGRGHITGCKGMVTK